MYKHFDAQIDAILSKMSLDDKIGQLNQICYSTKPDRVEGIKDMIRRGRVGSLILAESSTAGNDTNSVIDRAMLDEYQRIAIQESPTGIPLIFGRDVIYGHHTVYPIPLAQSCAFNPDLIEKCYSEIALEATSEGIHWTFTPMLDLCRDPRWGRIIESAGEDPYVASRIASAVVKGVQGDLGDGKMVACAKHFIGYGAAEGGRDYHHTEISDYSLYNYYLPAFRSAIENGAGTVMSSFNDINGENVGSSEFYMQDVLRDHLGFEGFVVSDWGGVNLLRGQGTAANAADCAEKCINAGTDMDMVESSYILSLRDLVESGRVSEETIDRAVRRILRIKLAKGLFEKPYSSPQPFDRAEHIKSARHLASESMVLLKNENGALPLSKAEKIILVGPMADERRSLLGSWTLDGLISETPTLREAFCRAIGSENVLNSLDGDADTIVLALGESNQMNGEAHSLADISVSSEQKTLIRAAKETGKRVIGVMCFGRPVGLEAVAGDLDAILYAWQSGSQTSPAVCDLIFGDASPSGRLSVSFPKHSGHIPIYYNGLRPGKRVNAYYSDVWEGALTACYIDGLAEPMYPFGFGLTYSEFSYGEITADKTELPLSDLEAGETFKVHVTLKNVGDCRAKETVQLYVSDRLASVMRPARELKGYKKCDLCANESTTVTFEIGRRELGFYLKNGKFTLERGEFELFVGENCLTNRKIIISVI